MRAEGPNWAQRESEWSEHPPDQTNNLNTKIKHHTAEYYLVSITPMIQIFMLFYNIQH